MKGLIQLLLAVEVALTGCATKDRTVLSMVAPVEPVEGAVRVPVPELAGVIVQVQGEWLELFSPPTLEQAMLQASVGVKALMDHATRVQITRTDGRVFRVARERYGDFQLENNDRIHIPRRIF